ncbi:MAG: hypothetical protein M5U30_10270 [Burkholderiaceae bacterium]|nr:hypothetical protein [Burkholderiaceae bacterium]
MQIEAGRRPLSLAKLTAPQPNRAWPRRRLFERLDAARRNGNIVWIAAPAGSGKTTLVASYLQARKLRAARYRIDAADADPASFFHYLAQAVGPGRGRDAGALPAFTAEYLAGLAVFARNWFRRFFARLHGVPLLVLDDYHQLPADSPVHVALREGLAEVPPGVSVITTSRGEPPPLLTRLRTLENFTLFDREALRLSADECVGVARQRLAGDAPADAVLHTLHERTQGWVAGLVLMLERGPASTPGEAGSPVDPLVFDYFAGELLAQAEPRLQRFLLRTALLPRFTAASAAALTGQDDAAALLAEIDRRNFFVARHAGAGQGDASGIPPAVSRVPARARPRATRCGRARPAAQRGGRSAGRRGRRAGQRGAAARGRRLAAPGVAGARPGTGAAQERTLPDARRMDPRHPAAAARRYPLARLLPRPVPAALRPGAGARAAVERLRGLSRRRPRHRRIPVVGRRRGHLHLRVERLRAVRSVDRRVRRAARAASGVSVARSRGARGRRDLRDPDVPAPAASGAATLDAAPRRAGGAGRRRTGAAHDRGRAPAALLRMVGRQPGARRRTGPAHRAVRERAHRRPVRAPGPGGASSRSRTG